jgi:hypothetical protein
MKMCSLNPEKRDDVSTRLSGPFSSKTSGKVLSLSRDCPIVKDWTGDLSAIVAFMMSVLIFLHPVRASVRRCSQFAENVSTRNNKQVSLSIALEEPCFGGPSTMQPHADHSIHSSAAFSMLDIPTEINPLLQFLL